MITHRQIYDALFLSQYVFQHSESYDVEVEHKCIPNCIEKQNNPPIEH